MAAGQLSGWQAATLIRAFIAVAAVVAVALIFGKKGVIALALILFVGALLASERKTQWRLLGHICRLPIILLSMLIWVVTLSMAARSGFTAMVVSTLLPGIAQAYWIGELLAAGKSLSHPFILMCGAWLVLCAICMVAYAKAGPPEPDHDMA
jgi:hypothetical protein